MSQTFSNKLDLADIFQNIDYAAILRISPDFPNYKAGSDVDILVPDKYEVIEGLRSLHTLVEHQKGPGHVHLDSMIGGKIDIRFDLYAWVISKEFTRDLWMSRRHVIIDGVRYYVPSDEFDGMLKCNEYITYPKRKQKYKDFLKYKPQLDEYKN